MKITALALSTLGLASLTAGQNGNDPLILNNRTGLAPVVYDTFSTSYTTSNEPVDNGMIMTVPVTPSPVRSNTFLFKPTTSVKCWRNGYPCGQNGGKRSQRRATVFARATPTIDEVHVTLPPAWESHRVPLPEFFSTRTDVQLSGQTEVLAEMGEMTIGILPIPTEFTGEKHYDAPPSETDAFFSILPISTPTVIVPTLTTSVVIPPVAKPTGTPTTTSGLAIPPKPKETIVDSFLGFTTKGFAIPPELTARGVPIDWWRGPGQPVGPDAPLVPEEGIVGSIQRHSVTSSGPSGPPSMRPIVSPVSTDACFHHYCPSGKETSTKVLETTIRTTFKPVAPTGAVVSSFPAVPPNTSTLVV
ncbi:hypothetical protein BU25DRAFT_453142 [Macroventuria anomochaeta]|uniref:Uncharacterized protein n=1 Tax=Macroventuria anomochaeta TaxID=301207 RepID=A0ACB6SGA4_9PLEO|nr:uncharacterized protein BU25DRAFT_453142 [Macroventuria anomochaeta]KAF2633366.1 hypothetical protein BU25DRAFT_453142 [Macroventuria anomochaeta]